MEMLFGNLICIVGYMASLNWPEIIGAAANVAMACAAIWAAKWQWPRQIVKQQQFSLAGKFLAKLDALERDFVTTVINADQFGVNTEASRNLILRKHPELVVSDAELKLLAGEVGVFFPPEIHLKAVRSAQTISLALTELLQYAEGFPAETLELTKLRSQMLSEIEEVDLAMRHFLWQKGVVSRSERWSKPEWQEFVKETEGIFDRKKQRIKKHFPVEHNQ